MTSLFNRLDEEEAIVRGELTALREKVAQTEERLARLTITRETAALLLGVKEAAKGGTTAGPSASSRGGADPETGGPGNEQPAGATASQEESSGPELEELPLEVARERILTVLAQKGDAVKLKDLCLSIGEKRVETTRSRLKAMVKQGLAVESPVGWFSLAHKTRAVDEEAWAA
ncbi:hypothetical protein ACMATS_22355 [Streptoverticillium reticulum]|uniref:hypothetical protein n=1 Tax=Streptoverticillium reticulum TaxID=1433415 RepID=UPI0039BFEFB7